MKAFTLVESLVVVCVIGILLGVGLPVLSKSLDAGKKVKEVSAIKNLITAYNLYSSDNNNLLIKSYDLNGTAFDINGRQIGGEESHESHRWPWRLAPYFNYDFYGCTLVNEAARYIKKQGGLTQTYLVSVLPSFGLNIYLGGNDYEGMQYQNRIASSLVQVTRPSQTIAFVSSRSMAVGERFEGFYYVDVPKNKSKYDPRSNPKSTGYISARYSGNAIVAFLNGNVSILEYHELTDSKKWYPLEP
jgi:type II secretory pathway pseudopilin PulG